MFTVKITFQLAYVKFAIAPEIILGPFLFAILPTTAGARTYHYRLHLSVCLSMRSQNYFY